jgi:1-acyl-sn-glycerol-3-phosphate acyltransferase
VKTRALLFFLPAPVRGTIASLLLALNTILWTLPILALALVNVIVPLRAVRVRIDPMLNALASCWVACNSGWMRLVQSTEWDVEGVPQGQRSGWFLVNCNHQSWADIFILQRLLNGRVPMLKFFLKQELLYVPLIGLAWWALDFPFMKRHDKAALRRNPSRRTDDAEATLRACGKFALVPTSVMNFAEGTRFTRGKHGRQNSPYRHLLKPRAGALGFTLQAMGGKFESLLDVTIAYSPRVPGFWDFLCGRMDRIAVRMRELPVPPQLCEGDYAKDAAQRARLQQWLADLWREKDLQLDELQAAFR